jgi:hypothetical protein
LTPKFVDYSAPSVAISVSPHFSLDLDTKSEVGGLIPFSLLANMAIREQVRGLIAGRTWEFPLPRLFPTNSSIEIQYAPDM